MVNKADIVDAALSYVGTPYQHQARAPGKGLDCAGVVECAYRAAGCDVAIESNYDRVPDGARLRNTLESYLDRTSKPEPGDVMLIAYFGIPHHLAIFNNQNMIHAYSNIGRCVHHRIDALWRRLTIGYYAWRDI